MLQSPHRQKQTLDSRYTFRTPLVSYCMYPINAVPAQLYENELSYALSLFFSLFFSSVFLSPLHTSSVYSVRSGLLLNHAPVPALSDNESPHDGGLRHGYGAECDGSLVLGSIKGACLLRSYALKNLHYHPKGGTNCRWCWQ